MGSSEQRRAPYPRSAVPSDLGINGLPVASCPPAENAWSSRSAVLAGLPADPHTTMHPGIVALPRDDVGGGMGLFTTVGIIKNSIVWAEPTDSELINPIPRSRAWIEGLPPLSRKAYCHFMYKTGDDEYQSLAEFNSMSLDELPPEELIKFRTKDIASYMNHSCEPSAVFVDAGEAYAGVMVATRDLLPGDEVTYDYCTSEDDSLSPTWSCLCGAAGCRGTVTHEDWALPRLQEAFAGHFLPHIAAKVAAARGEAAVPLRPVDDDACWWLMGLKAAWTSPAARSVTEAPSDDADQRHALLAEAASGRELDTINRQAASLVLHHRLHVQGEAGGPLGRYQARHRHPRSLDRLTRHSPHCTGTS